MNKKILIVDDDKNTRIVLRDLLEERKYAIVEAADEKEAMDMVYGEKPDIALIDTRLDVNMEGDELCKQIKQIEDLDIKVIVYTGKIDAIDILKAREAGADDYVVKTWDFDLLLKAIMEVQEEE